MSKPSPMANAIVVGSMPSPSADGELVVDPASFFCFISSANGPSSLSRSRMLYWIISMAMPASLTFSMDSWLMSAWLRSISARTLVVASMGVGGGLARGRRGHGEARVDARLGLLLELLQSLIDVLDGVHDARELDGEGGGDCGDGGTAR